MVIRMRMALVLCLMFTMTVYSPGLWAAAKQPETKNSDRNVEVDQNLVVPPKQKREPRRRVAQEETQNERHPAIGSVPKSNVGDLSPKDAGSNGDSDDPNGDGGNGDPGPPGGGPPDHAGPPSSFPGVGHGVGGEPPAGGNPPGTPGEFPGPGDFPGQSGGSQGHGPPQTRGNSNE